MLRLLVVAFLAGAAATVITLAAIARRGAPAPGAPALVLPPIEDWSSDPWTFGLVH